MNLTKNQKSVISKIENLLNIKILEKCSAVKRNIINYDYDFKNREELRIYVSYLASNLELYRFCKIETGPNGIIIRII